MTTITHKRLPAGATLMDRIRIRFHNWREDRAYRKSVELVPDSLRYDVGLDGGAPVGPSDRQPGHSFDHTRQLPPISRFQ